MLEPKTKFSIKVFLKYLVLDPWTEKIRINYRTIIWFVMILAIIFKRFLILFIAIVLGIILHGVKEYKAGKHIHWYRQRKFGEREKARKKIRETRNQEQKPFYTHVP